MARKSIGYVQLEWNCPSCGVRNIGTQRICQGCGLPQPDNVSFQKPAQDRIIEDEKLISAAKKGADIHCAYCGARNPAGSINCIQCAADLTSGKKRQAGVILGALQTAEVPQQLCANCKTPNPETNKTCSKCGAPLKNSSQPLSVDLPKKKINPIWIILAAIVGVIICVLLAITLFSGGDTSSVTGVVDSVYWERSVAIQSMT